MSKNSFYKTTASHDFSRNVSKLIDDFKFEVFWIQVKIYTLKQSMYLVAYLIPSVKLGCENMMIWESFGNERVG